MNGGPVKVCFQPAAFFNPSVEDGSSDTKPAFILGRLCRAGKCIAHFLTREGSCRL